MCIPLAVLFRRLVILPYDSAVCIPLAVLFRSLVALLYDQAPGMFPHNPHDASAKMWEREYKKSEEANAQLRADVVRLTAENADLSLREATRKQELENALSSAQAREREHKRTSKRADKAMDSVASVTSCVGQMHGAMVTQVANQNDLRDRLSVADDNLERARASIGQRDAQIQYKNAQIEHANATLHAVNLHMASAAEQIHQLSCALHVSECRIASLVTTINHLQQQAPTPALAVSQHDPTVGGRGRSSQKGRPSKCAACGNRHYNGTSCPMDPDGHPATSQRP